MIVVPEHTKFLFIVIVIIILSGLGDSLGFLYAAKIWQEGKLVWPELAKSALGFSFGIVMYWIALRFLWSFGVISAEIQTIIWFGVTIVGVALLSGRFLRWQAIDQLAAIAVLIGIGWLLINTGE